MPSKYDPCPMSVLEALASGVPVIATTEVGSIEALDRSIAAEVAIGDVEAMADEITRMLERLRADPAGVRQRARAEAERRFSRDVVCKQISDALEALVERSRTAAVRSRPAPPDRVPTTESAGAAARPGGH
jgi:glycosyltransferase involved in cell wall biosynthesis